jgi:hypothetical protein
MKFSDAFLRRISLTLFLSACFMLFAFTSLIVVPAGSYSLFINAAATAPDTTAVSASELKELQRKAELLEQRVSRLSSTGNSFLIINTTDNTFRLYRNREIIGSGLCSTGSLIHLEVDSTRNWIFETPKGVLRVRNKIVDPVWRKPDWAFIEDGLQPPPFDHPSRFERNVLGDYALDLGNGYLIHGTLYQRLLGMPVTHGCIRMNDNDLELVYQTLNVGSKVYIY